jgi:hypothetical protein
MDAQGTTSLICWNASEQKKKRKGMIETDDLFWLPNGQINNKKQNAIVIQYKMQRTPNCKQSNKYHVVRKYEYRTVDCISLTYLGFLLLPDRVSFLLRCRLSGVPFHSRYPCIGVRSVSRSQPARGSDGVDDTICSFSGIGCASTSNASLYCNRDRPTVV